MLGTGIISPQFANPEMVEMANFSAEFIRHAGEHLKILGNCFFKFYKINSCCTGKINYMVVSFVEQLKFLFCFENLFFNDQRFSQCNDFRKFNRTIYHFLRNFILNLTFLVILSYQFMLF